MRPTLLTLTLFLFASLSLSAQNAGGESGTGKEKAVKRQNVSDRRSPLTIGTNLFDWVDFGTINLDFGVPVAQKWSLVAGAKYNPWTFKPKTGDYSQVYNKQMSFSLGARFWPWYVNSGWWICAKAQYTDYSITGVWRPALDTGKALGAGLSAGYSLMINKHLNLDFGAGFWGGRLLEHTVYNSLQRMEVRETGPKNFIAINDITISIQYLF